MSHDMKNQQNECAPSEDSDQPGHLPSLIRVFAVRMKEAWVLSYPLSAQWRLWSDWADAQADLSLRWVHSHFVGLAYHGSFMFQIASAKSQVFFFFYKHWHHSLPVPMFWQTKKIFYYMPKQKSVGMLRKILWHLPPVVTFCGRTSRHFVYIIILRNLPF